MSVAWALSSQSSVTVRAARRLRQALNVEKAINAHGGPAHGNHACQRRGEQIDLARI